MTPDEKRMLIQVVPMVVLGGLFVAALVVHVRRRAARFLEAVAASGLEQPRRVWWSGAIRGTWQGFVAEFRHMARYKGVPERVQLTIEAEEHRDVVLVPAAAVTHEGEEAAVFVVNGEKAERRVVMLGITDDAHAEIRSGIKAGDAVIVTGQAGLPDGAAITLTKPEPEK